MISNQQYGPWALIAGGSEGLGASFAVKLAEAGINLILVARRPEPLDKLSHELLSHHKVEVRTLAIDFNRPDMLERIGEVTDDIEVGLLIFNAGDTNNIVGNLIERELKDVLASVRVTVLGQTMLAHYFGSKMAERGRGGIILVGSISGAAGTPGMATYCGSKAYSQIFAESLWSELRPKGVNVLSLVLGFTDTPARSGNGVTYNPRMPLLNTDEVAVQALDNLSNGGPVYVPAPYDKVFQSMCSAPRRQLAESMIGSH